MGLMQEPETLSLVEWVRKSGLAYETVYSRLRNGWPPNEALFRPLSKGQRLAFLKE